MLESYSWERERLAGHLFVPIIPLLSRAAAV